MTTVRARSESERALLEEAKRLQAAIVEKIQRDHEQVDKLKRDARLAYQQSLQSQGLEGVRLANFLKRNGLWLEGKRR